MDSIPRMANPALGRLNRRPAGAGTIPVQSFAAVYGLPLDHGIRRPDRDALGNMRSIYENVM